jgi:DNA protecting protein DprA
VSELALAAYCAESGRHVLSTADPGFRQFDRGFDEAGLRTQLAAAGLRWLARSDDRFPSTLASVFDPPVGLFVRGEAPLDLLDRPAVAIVGARACSSYGSHVARMLGRELTAAGLVVVSGMARGIDGEAHRGALEAGGATVAVLGCGVDRDYPAAHAQLARRICGDGLVVSEYAPGVEPAPWRFPARNRIVAGLAQVTVVVEARAKSGALITADLALEEGREVYAVPGEITSALSAGTNALIRLGATVTTSAADVLEAFGLAPPEPEPPELTPPAAAIQPTPSFAHYGCFATRGCSSSDADAGSPSQARPNAAPSSYGRKNSWRSPATRATGWTSSSRSSSRSADPQGLRPSNTPAHWHPPGVLSHAFTHGVASRQRSA